jgi:hypothetical protein
MLFGDRTGSVLRIERYAVHGDPMVRLWVDFDGAGPAGEPIQLGPEAVGPELRSGDRIAVTMVAGVPTAARRTEDQNGPDRAREDRP